MSLSKILYLVFLAISIILSAFFSAAETAFMSVQKVKLQHMVDTNVRGARRVAKIRGGRNVLSPLFSMAITKMKGVKIEEILVTREEHAATAH